MEIPASEMSADVSWDARLYPNADRDIVGCDHHRARRDPESVRVFDGENLLAEYDILVLTAGPVQVNSKFLPQPPFKLRPEEREELSPFCLIGSEIGVVCLVRKPD